MENLDDVISVSALSLRLKDWVENNQLFQGLSVIGEAIKITRSLSGIFFTLMDRTDSSNLNCVIFKTSPYFNSFSQVKEGDKIVCKGSVGIYNKSSTYNLKVSSFTLSGIGDKLAQIEQLKQRLIQKGIVSRHRPLKEYPDTIALVVPKSSDAEKDVIKNIIEEYPFVKIISFYALVSGNMAVDSIINAVIQAESSGADFMIIARGGGNRTDLFPFDDEKVVLQIYNSKIPTIVGVGHENDHTVSEIVADIIASTPTGAGKIAVPNKKKLFSNIERLKEKINSNYFDQIRFLSDKITNNLHFINTKSPANLLKRMELERKHNIKQIQTLFLNKIKSSNQLIDINKNKLKNPLSRIVNTKEKVINQKKVLRNLLLNKITLLRQKIDTNLIPLQKYNPDIFINKGYSVLKVGDKVITSIKDVEVGSILDINVSDGLVRAQVKEKKKK